MNYILSNVQYLDIKIQNLILYLRSEAWDSFFMSITKIGGWPMILFILICFSLLCYLFKKREFILPLAVAMIGSGIMTLIIKYLVNRARPGADIAMYMEKLPSFPSAHAVLTFTLFGFFFYCIWKFRINLILKIFLSVLFVLIIILVGFSRIYLGVHFTSDVLAGYLAGLMWLLIAMYISHKKFLTLDHYRS
jgi:undecaprenyl-diphosphatase